MGQRFRWILLLGMAYWLLPSTTFAERVRFNSLQIDAVSGWKIQQSALVRDTRIIGLKSGSGYVLMYSRPESVVNIREVFENRLTKLVDSKEHEANGLKWNLVTVQKRGSEKFTTGFLTAVAGSLYYGYVTSQDRSSATRMALDFLTKVSL